MTGWWSGPRRGTVVNVDSSALTGLLVTVAVLAAATAFGLWRRRRDGRVRAVAAPAPAEKTLLESLGVERGTPATLLQFSSAFCVPCRATRRVLAETAATLAAQGVRHVEVDAESHLDAVRALDIWKTPTTLIVDAEGKVVHRATGIPVKAQVVAAVAPLLTRRRAVDHGRLGTTLCR
jgi:thiol-disulfide isomerase/thioredoxin